MKSVGRVLGCVCVCVGMRGRVCVRGEKLQLQNKCYTLSLIVTRQMHYYKNRGETHKGPCLLTKPIPLRLATRRMFLRAELASRLSHL